MEAFKGKYERVSVDNMDEFLKEMGVNIDTDFNTQQLKNSSNLVCVIFVYVLALSNYLDKLLDLWVFFKKVTLMPTDDKLFLGELLAEEGCYSQQPGGGDIQLG